MDVYGCLNEMPLFDEVLRGLVWMCMFVGI